MLTNATNKTPKELRWNTFIRVLEKMNDNEIKDAYYYLIAKYSRELNNEKPDGNGRYLSDTRDIT